MERKDFFEIFDAKNNTTVQDVLESEHPPAAPRYHKCLESTVQLVIPPWYLIP